MDTKGSKFLCRSILTAMSLGMAVLSAFAGNTLTNPPDCDNETPEKKCPCTCEDGCQNSCVKINLGMGSTTPWSGSVSASLRVFADDFSPSVFTPECLYPILGYTYKRLGQTVLSDGKTPKEVVFTHPNGEPVYFVFNNGETTAMPDRGRHIKMDERLMMVDAAGWATTKDPVYYDLYENDGSVRRFLASDKTGDRGRLVYIKDCRGVVTTPEDMGVDFVRNADGLRQFLTPSRLADVVLRTNGYDVNIYALQDVPVKDPATGLYQVPASAPVTALTIRRGAGGRRIDVTWKRGSVDPVPYVYEYADGDWSLTHVEGRKEVKTKQVSQSVGARITKSDYAADGSLLSYSCKNYKSFGWGFSMTNKIEGTGSAQREVQWAYVESGYGKGLVSTERISTGLVTKFTYDSVDRTIREARTGNDMLTEVTERSFASLDPSDVVPPVDSRPRTTVKSLDGVEVERTYHVYGPWTEITERAAAPGAAYGAAGAMRTVRTYWDADSGVKAGKVKSIRREDGRLDAYDYALADGIWTETVTHLHEQAMDPVSGKTARDVSVMNGRGETLEYRTEAFVAGTWYTVAKTMQEYNAQGKVVRSTDLAGRVTTTAWDCCHKISETKPDGQTTTWDYDAEGRMIASSRLIPLDMTNVTWVTTCYSYDGLGRQTATWTTNYTAHIGIPATTTSYDGLGRVVARIDALGNVTTTSYSPDGRTVSVRKPNGATIITTRNSNGDTLSITGTGVTPEFHSRGVLADGTRWTKTVQGATASSPRFTKSYENMLGQSVRSEKSGFRGAVLASVNTYDAYGRLVSTASDGEPTTESHYDVFGSRIATITSVGRGLRAAPQDAVKWRKSESHSAYALLGNDVWAVQTNVVSCSDATIAPLVQSRAERVTGLTASLLSQSLTTDARGNVSESRVEYNGFAKVGINISPAQTGRAESHSRLGVAVRSVSASGVESRSLYDGLGRQVASIDGRGNATRTEYDAFGRQLATIDPDNNRTTYAYNEFGELVSVTNALGDAVEYAYDLRGHKVYEGGATYPVSYSYDVFGNKVSMTTYRAEGTVTGDTTRWRYDEASNCMTNKVYADKNGTKYEYDAHGRLTKRTWARGIDTTYTYDAWGSLTRTDYSYSTPSVVLCYDVMGRQTRAVDAAGITTFAYDSFGSLTNETVIGVAGTNTIERFYDTFGRDTGYALNGVRQSTLGYDAATGRLATMQAAGSETPFAWNFLPGSDFKSLLTYPNGLTARWAYGNRDELLEVNNASPAGTISRYAYTYDAAGRRIGCDKSGSAFATSDTNLYLYNARSELTNATAAIDSDYRYGYDFDDIGNRKTSAERGTNSVYTASQLNQYAAVDDFTPVYDADGNQTVVKTATGIWNIVYNGENRPVRWTQGDAVITMSFDRMGRRVTKNDQCFVYDGYLQVASFEQSNNRTFEHFFLWDPTESIATRPLVWTRNGDFEYYVFDGNKNVSEAIASNNDVAAHYEYAPFGALTVRTGALAAVNPWRFSSEYSEDDTATVYYNYRHYEPTNGRWVGRDLILERGGRNLYAYCINRPLNMCDGLGLYSSVGIETHQNILKHALNALLNEGVAPCLKNDAALKEYVLKALQQANAGMDKKYNSADELYLHYNRKMGVDSEDEIDQVKTDYQNELEKRRTAAGEDINDGLCWEALVQLGELTHMTQDYWGHGVSYEYKGTKETLYYWEDGEKYPCGEVVVYPSDDVIGEATGDPDNPMMKPSNYNGYFGNSEHGPLRGREPGNRAPDGTGWAVPGKWKYNEGRLGKAVDYTKQDLRRFLGKWCEKCCNLLNRSYYWPGPAMPEVFEALNNLNW